LNDFVIGGKSLDYGAVIELCANGDFAIKNELTELILQYKLGEQLSENRLFVATYKQFKLIAKQAMTKSQKSESNFCLSDVVHSTTSLVHDAYLKLHTADLSMIENRKMFYLLVATTMRHILVDYFRKRNSQKRGRNDSALHFIDREDDFSFQQSQVEQYFSFEQAIESLQAEYPRPSDIMQLKHFSGLHNKEIAELMKLSESTVEKDLKFARGWISLSLAVS